eukprot:maker-scaffold_2-augustus-gene-26.34-mRNA-1 protein AED:0.03 eAED:0.03 QI:126/1/1/1/1/1/3/56/208
MKTMKIVIVGDGGVGKSTLLAAYMDPGSYQSYMDKMQPTVLENYQVTVPIRDERIKVDIWDTAGQEALQDIRKLSYEGTNVFLFCFSCTESASFRNVDAIWLPETIRPSSERTSFRISVNKEKKVLPVFVLVGTKMDLIKEAKREGRGYISSAQGKEYALSVGGKDYVRCSAKKYIGVKLVFKKAFVEGLKQMELLDKRSYCSCIPLF